jgi:hypothetical protein
MLVVTPDWPFVKVKFHEASALIEEQVAVAL